MDRPPYLRIADAVAALVEDGTLRPGDAVPSARRLRDEHGVALATATRALAELRERGLTVVVPGVGTRVADGVRAGRRAASPAGPRTGPRPVGRPGSGPPPGVTVTEVVATAVRIADTEGMTAMSIRRIASELGLPTMAVYRFVPSKDRLVTLMTDRVFGETTLPRRPPAGWRAALEHAARLQWGLHRRHPWLAGTMSFTRPVLAPEGMRWTEWLMAVLDDEGVGPTEQLQLAMTVAGFVHGMGAKLETELEDEQHTGMSAAEWMAQREAAFAAAAGRAGERFPRLTRAADVTDDSEFDLDALFEIGLGIVLDGIAVRLGRGAGG